MTKNKVLLLNKIQQRGLLSQSRQFISSGMIINTIVNILTLGVSKTSLELIQMNKMLKVKNKLRKKYAKELNKPLLYQEGVNNRVIWSMWLQGFDSAPEIVKKAISSIKQSLPDEKVILLDKHNFSEYVSIPDDIVSKWENGVISNPHFSDIVRMELLIQNGGTWFDSTIMLNKNFDLLQNIMNSDKTFFFQNMRPGQMGNSIWISNWFIHTRSNEPTLIKVREILYKYWRTHNYAVDYFLFHIIWQLVYEKHDAEYAKVKKVPNSLPLQLMYILNDKNDRQLTEDILAEFPLQKLTYKDISTDNDTTYSYLLRR